MSVVVFYTFLILLLSGLALSEETTVSNVTQLNQTSIVNGTVLPLLPENLITNVDPEINPGLNGTNSTGALEINGTFPFQASIYFNYNEEFICGGLIVSNSTILTLASCMYYEWGGILPPVIVKIVVGRTSLSSSGTYSVEAEKIIFYSLFSEETLENDLAIIQLKNTLQFTSAVGNATVDAITTVGAYNSCVATGWSTTTGEIQEIAVTIVNCSQSYSSNKICTQTKQNNATICDYALGGSLVCDGELVGVLSTVPTCNVTGSVAAFENLRSAITWLKSNNVVSSAASFMTVPLRKGSIYNNLFILLPLIASVIVGLLLKA